MEKENYKAIRTVRDKAKGTYKVESFAFAVAAEVLRNEGFFGDYEDKSLLMAYDYRNENK